jgi:hypothetical protein
MNDAVLSIDYIIYNEEERSIPISILELNHMLNRTPMMKIQNFPFKMMIDALNELYLKN